MVTTIPKNSFQESYANEWTGYTAQFQDVAEAVTSSSPSFSLEDDDVVSTSIDKRVREILAQADNGSLLVNHNEAENLPPNTRQEFYHSLNSTLARYDVSLAQNHQRYLS